MTAINTLRTTGTLCKVPVKGETKIDKGHIVILDGGYAKEATKAENLIVIGIADHSVDNQLGENGDKEIVIRRNEAYLFTNAASNAAVGITEVGKKVHIHDSYTVTKTSSGSTELGKVIGLDDGKVWVFVT